ncbi:Uncharacterised protein [Bordetella pertussis]|nr:Uncharacterised protein [Bordetella pertussis]
MRKRSLSFALEISAVDGAAARRGAFVLAVKCRLVDARHIVNHRTVGQRQISVACRLSIAHLARPRPAIGQGQLACVGFRAGIAALENTAVRKTHDAALGQAPALPAARHLPAVVKYRHALETASRTRQCQGIFEASHARLGSEELQPTRTASLSIAPGAMPAPLQTAVEYQTKRAESLRQTQIPGQRQGLGKTFQGIFAMQD